MKLQLLRNATLVLTINGKNYLVDPMLCPKDGFNAIPNTANTLKNPLIDLPLNDKDLRDLIARTEAVLLTHIHPDHWDTIAQEMIPKGITLFCQPENSETIEQSGFSNVNPITDEITWNNFSIYRTGGHHGTGKEGELMGVVSGYVIKNEQYRLYIAGDTIWCDEVAEAIEKHKPTHIVLNGGAARFVTGDPIVMDINDILTVCRIAPEAKIYVVHLEALNHSTESREEIKIALKTNGFADRAFVPNDGESIVFGD